MARKGEIDPWNIDVIDVTDKFLRRIEEAKKLDLRVSGRVLLYAAILVRMKADAITRSMQPDECDVEIIENLAEEPLEDFEIEELPIAGRRRVRKICTLEDLIMELKKAEEMEKRRKKRREIADLNFVVSIPHDESMEKKILEVENFLTNILRKRKSITLFSVAESREKLLDLYISLLHLVSRKKFWMHQSEFYGDIEIRFYEEN
uniref:Segregation/condensation protein A n=1 Tax=Archaeoglobus fulgidus TaxID=2234 RepID=A0A7J2TIT5_ARCFL